MSLAQDFNTAQDALEVYRAVERLRNAVAARYPQASGNAAAGAATEAAGGLPGGRLMVVGLDMLTAAIENPVVAAIGITAVVVLVGMGAIALSKEVRG